MFLAHKRLREQRVEQESRRSFRPLSTLIAPGLHPRHSPFLLFGASSCVFLFELPPEDKFVLHVGHPCRAHS
eukprot:2285132-Amphidinium_carterae.1